MDYLKWSKEYSDDAELILRNIARLKEKQLTAPENERQTLADSIVRLRMIYYDCIHTASYLAERAGEKNECVA
ncbi:MAG: hypothetical protein ACI4GZ_03565 [Ruminococcus sp.]